MIIGIIASQGGKQSVMGTGWVYLGFYGTNTLEALNENKSKVTYATTCPTSTKNESIAQSIFPVEEQPIGTVIKITSRQHCTGSICYTDEIGWKYMPCSDMYFESKKKIWQYVTYTTSEPSSYIIHNGDAWPSSDDVEAIVTAKTLTIGYSLHVQFGYDFLLFEVQYAIAE